MQQETHVDLGGRLVFQSSQSAANARAHGHGTPTPPDAPRDTVDTDHFTFYVSPLDYAYGDSPSAAIDARELTDGGLEDGVDRFA